MKIILASNNEGKIKEFNALLSHLQIEVIPQSEFGVKEIEETGLTFVENALIKARHASHVTGLPAIADDSGLVVPALNGEPGIFSARYAGKKASSIDNINKLLFELNDMPNDKRQAQFHCTLVFISNETDPIPLICDGAWSGSILHEPVGKSGFGYDPTFYVPEMNCSAAELALDVKNKMSHRGKALQLLLTHLPEKL